MAKEMVSTSDLHFTVLGFTAGTGQAIMCAIIFAAKEVTLFDQLGIDVTKEILQGSTSTYENNGPGLRYPGGPTCFFRNKEVPCFIGCSPKGGITSELFVKMLKRMDGLDLFPRTKNGPLPFILLDGHDSRFSIDFLRYINAEATKWVGCLGLPNGTAYWQVGDSSEQNGMYKMSLVKAKRRLLRNKKR